MNQLMQQLMGLSRDRLRSVSDGIWLHEQVIGPFNELRESAIQHGISLVIASGFRDFNRQLLIWNDKASGKRVVFSRDGRSELDVSTLTSEQLMYAILRWSALPGASRHHWGTDMDVWDASAVQSNYQLRLTPDEYSKGGPFEKLNRWMDGGAFERLGFCRPYLQDQGGVSPEPWHISFRPLADRFSDEFDLSSLVSQLESTEIRLKEVILENIADIHQRYIRC